MFPKGTVSDGGVFRYVARMPEASYNVNAFLAKNIKYPQKAIINNAEALINVMFVVDEEGQIKEIQRKGVYRYGYGLEEEAVRVVSTLPKWNPGLEHNRPVKVYFTLPIRFQLTD
jgi:protein TonB